MEVDVENDPILKILKLRAADRSAEQLQQVNKYMSQVSFFRQLTDEQQKLELCRYITFERVQRGDIVFQEGSHGVTFYIIFSGAVKILVVDDRFKATPGHLGSCVAVLEDGDSFGELALLGNGERKATAQAAMDTLMLKVEKEHYETSLGHVHAVEHATRVNFLQRVFLFNDWDDEMLTKLAMVVSCRKYPKHSTIIQQGTMTNYMYFIVSGKCRILKRMELTQAQREARRHPRRRRRRAAPRLQARAERRRRGRRVARVAADARSVQRHAPQPPQPPQPSTTPDGASFLELNGLTVHQFFGERSLLDGAHKGVHSASVVTTTPVECLLLSKHDFYHFIDAKTQAVLKAYGEKFYFDEERIRRAIVKQHKWVEYKKDLVKDVLSPRPRGGR